MKSTGKSRTIYVHEEDYEYLRQIGGSYAEGLRKAVEAHRAAAPIYERMEKGSPPTPQLEDKI